MKKKVIRFFATLGLALCVEALAFGLMVLLLWIFPHLFSVSPERIPRMYRILEDAQTLLPLSFVAVMTGIACGWRRAGLYPALLLVLAHGSLLIASNGSVGYVSGWMNAFYINAPLLLAQYLTAERRLRAQRLTLEEAAASEAALLATPAEG